MELALRNIRAQLRGSTKPAALAILAHIANALGEDDGR